MRGVLPARRTHSAGKHRAPVPAKIRACKQIARIPRRTVAASFACLYIRCITLHGVHHLMATQKPRITISLDRDVYDTLRGLSEAQGCTMSGLVSDLLTMVNPVQQRVLEAVTRARVLDAEAKENMVASLEAGQDQFEQMLGPLLGLLDQMSSGQPPHSNTGVTNTNQSGDEDKKTASKARPRAVQPDMFDTKTQKPKNPKTQTRKSTKAPANGA